MNLCITNVFKRCVSFFLKEQFAEDKSVEAYGKVQGQTPDSIDFVSD